MENLSCQLDLETFISDFNIFKNGGETSDVVLSDGFVMPSYRKYAISDLSRAGNTLKNHFYLEGDIVSYNGDIYLCLADNQVSNLTLNPTFWKKQGNPLSSEISGKGISAYLDFDFTTNDIISSKGIASIISNPNSGDLDITLTNYLPSNQKVCCVASVDIRKMPLTDIANMNYTGLEGKYYENSGGFNYSIPSGYYKKMIAGRVLSASGNNIKLSIRQGGILTDTTYNTLYTTPTAKTVNFQNTGQLNQFKPVVSFLFIAY